MKKLAVFVEGQTEQIFVAKLLEEIAGSKNIEIVSQKGCHKNGKRHFLHIDAQKKEPSPEKKYYVLIRDCGGESLVKTDIIESCESLSREHYELVLGLRDVYPEFTYDKVSILSNRLTFKVPTKYFPIHILLSIMEIEAWFLAESNHYSKINSSISKILANSKLGIDIDNIDVEQRTCPSSDLNEIYKIGGCAYKKDKKSVQRTIDVLDYNEIYINLPRKISGLKKFIEKIDMFFN